MLCERCGKNQASVRYTQIINNQGQEINLCEACSEELGLMNNMDFTMPISFSSFFGDFFKEFENNSFIHQLSQTQELKCKNCGLTFEEFLNNGKFGCSNCYIDFKDEIDPILKKIQGSNRHIGRLEKIRNERATEKTENLKSNIKEEKDELMQLKDELKKAIQEENYEHAAEIRDKIKEIEK